MRYGITPPWYQDPVEHTAFNAYAYSQQRIENFINALAATADPNDYSNQCAAAQCADININSLTRSEREYIEREVAKRWQG